MDRGEARLVVRRQFGAAQMEIAQRIVDELPALRRQRRECGAGLQRLVFLEQRQVLQSEVQNSVTLGWFSL